MTGDFSSKFALPKHFAKFSINYFEILLSHIILELKYLEGKDTIVLVPTVMQNEYGTLTQ